MQINPGGRLSPEDIVGRDDDIARYWTILERQSLVLAAERRIGKSHIVWKMEAEPRAGFDLFYQDLESVHSVLDLVRHLYAAIESSLTTLGKAKSKALSAWLSFAPKRIKDVELPDAGASWKILIKSTIEDVLKVTEPGHKLVLVWDELPLMVHNIGVREGLPRAIELLDLLRQMRQTHGSNLRFIFTGSIGLHLVLKQLRATGNANEPVNDMYNETVPPLGRASAIELASKLLETIEFSRDDRAAIADAIYAHVDGFPYYIHHVADVLSGATKKLSVNDVESAVSALVDADSDPAHLRYYEERIKKYYTADDARAALAVLDALAAAGTAELSRPTIANLVRHELLEFTDDRCREICRLLRQDHYLALNSSTRALSFRWTLVRRWWKAARL